MLKKEKNNKRRFIKSLKSICVDRAEKVLSNLSQAVDDDDHGPEYLGLPPERADEFDQWLIDNEIKELLHNGTACSVTSLQCTACFSTFLYREAFKLPCGHLVCAHCLDECLHDTCVFGPGTYPCRYCLFCESEDLTDDDSALLLEPWE